MGPTSKGRDGRKGRRGGQMNLRKRGKWMEGEGKDVDAPPF